MLNRIREFILSRRLIKPNDRVLAAVSGGPDSVFLLYALMALRDQIGFSLMAGHLNHCLRGQESDEDESFVRTLAKKEAINIISAKRDVAGYARSHKLSIETAARELRREFLLQLAEEHGCRRIATGHNRNDQAETVLMHIIRGSGLNGLKGIPAINGKFIRPMLSIDRQEITDLLKARDIPWREDSSNKSPEHTRNKIRLELLPSLKIYNPQIVQSLSHLADAAGTDLELIDDITERACQQTIKIHKAKINIDLSIFNSYNKGLQRNIFRQAILHIAQHGVVPTFESVENCIRLMTWGKVGSRYQAIPGIWCTIGYKSAEVSKSRAAVPTAKMATAKKLSIPGKTAYNGHIIAARIIGTHIPSKPLPPSTDTVHFDWDKLKGREITVGKRQPGDAMVPFGSSYEKKTKEFFIEAKVPRAKRDSWPVIRCGDRIIWLAGLRRSNHAPVTGETKNILKLEFLK